MDMDGSIQSHNVPPGDGSRRGLVTIDAAEWADVISTIHRAGRPHPGSRVIVSHANGRLQISTNHGSHSVHAEGTWAGHFMVRSDVFLSLAKEGFGKARFSLECFDNKLLCPGVVLRGEWSSAGFRRLVIPMGAPLAVLAGVADRLALSELEQLGIKGPITRAKDKRDAILDRAVRTLAPLGLCREELMSLLEARFGRLIDDVVG